MHDTQVLIVGAGPVGLSLALDLGQRGIRTTLVEKKSAPAFLPKMERVNARTMEMYRRMGLARKIRAAGLSSAIPMDVYIVLDLNQPPLLRLPYPSVAEAEASIRATTDGTAPLEPYQLISQYTLEPLLAKEAGMLPPVTFRWSTEYVLHEQDAGGVTTTVKVSDESTATIRADYLICFAPTYRPRGRAPGYPTSGSTTAAPCKTAFRALATRSSALERPARDSAGLARALASYGAPVTELDVPDQIAREIYGFDLILLRPDMHIVWRDNARQHDAADVARIATGH